MPQIVVLWTDALLFIFLIFGVLSIVAVRREPYWIGHWYQVAKSGLGMVTGLILVLYLVVALLDSMHFRPALDVGARGQGGPRYGVEVLSVLDLVLGPLRVQSERSYSAPLAAYLYNKEVKIGMGGEVRQFYPRLRYGGNHLGDPEQELVWDVVYKTIYGVIYGLTLWFLGSWLLLWILAYRSGGGWWDQLRLVLANRTVLPWRAVIIEIGLILILAAVATNLARYYHLLGTDKIGEDVLYQALKSVRTGMLIGILTTTVMLPAALVLGLMARYFRGWVDDIIQYVYTTLSSIPDVLLIAAVILMLQVYMDQHAAAFASPVERADLRLLFLCLVLGITSWTGLCRLLRGETFKLRELDYVQSAIALGVRPFTVLFRHVFPNVLHIIIIKTTLDFSGLVLAEAVLSYVNIGVDPTMNSWGSMINGARLELARDPIVWWSLIAAFLFMFTLVLAANLFADVVRDALDPQLR